MVHIVELPSCVSHDRVGWAGCLIQAREVWGAVKLTMRASVTDPCPRVPVSDRAALVSSSPPARSRCRVEGDARVPVAVSRMSMDPGDDGASARVVACRILDERVTQGQVTDQFTLHSGSYSPAGVRWGGRFGPSRVSRETLTQRRRRGRPAKAAEVGVRRPADGFACGCGASADLALIDALSR